LRDLNVSKSAVLGDGVPPLAPPLCADQDSELLMPAVGDLGRGFEIEPAGVTPFGVIIRMCLKDGVVGQVPELDR